MFFTGIHFSDCRPLRRTTTTTKIPMHYSTAEFYEYWRRGISDERRLSVVNSSDKYDLVYRVSGKKVPAGPNPLHNR
ncbi:unnamed protein product [Arabis nemorensis]|uniref:Uncharacterized protein n=1 Tax=Arabis nemorensis TaxID=586526 RepID=A0A565AP14_9BRAS|nr:unnamed protein product [Arabis nemorensis]